MNVNIYQLKEMMTETQVLRSFLKLEPTGTSLYYIFVIYYSKFIDIKKKNIPSVVLNRMNSKQNKKIRSNWETLLLQTELNANTVERTKIIYILL